MQLDRGSPSNGKGELWSKSGGSSIGGGGGSLIQLALTANSLRLDTPERRNSPDLLGNGLGDFATWKIGNVPIDPDQVLIKC